MCYVKLNVQCEFNEGLHACGEKIHHCWYLNLGGGVCVLLLPLETMQGVHVPQSQGTVGTICLYPFILPPERRFDPSK